MLTDRAFISLLIAALLLCGAARQVVSASRQNTALSMKQGRLDGQCMNLQRTWDSRQCDAPPVALHDIG